MDGENKSPVDRNILGTYRNPTHWSKIAIECYKRGCICSGCENDELIKKTESGDYCHVKALVLELVRLYGKPIRKEINYKEGCWEG